MEKQEIAYQNKDITSKVLAENFKGKTFRVYGLDLPGIKDTKPTNIPTVRANELRLDNLFELEDNSVAIVDYESKYDKADKIKYLNYLAGIANRYWKEKKECPLLRMVVIYMGDINIDKETANKIRRAIEMTQVAMIFEEEKQQAIKQAVEDSERKIVVNMIRKGYPTDEILFLMPGYSKDAIEAIREKSAKEEN